MRMRLTVLSLWCLCGASSLFCQMETRVDVPELARRGPEVVGYRQVEVVDHDRIDFLQSDVGKGEFKRGDRHLFVTIWYPAEGGDARAVAHYDRHPGAGPGSPYAESGQFPQTGRAVKDAAAKKGAAPLVIFSHGFTNWAAYAADLAESLASRGYVVASIDHDDLPFKDGATGARAFADTASGRARDQRAVARELRRLAGDGTFPLYGAYDPERLALMGYSMGGFGALESAGAGYEPKGAFFGLMPKALFGGLLEDEAQPIPGLKAIVLLAPWGAEPANRAWSAEALASIKVPALVIDGDHDDVAGFEEGVRWIYDHLKSSDRYLLVFENARHNVVGADAPAERFDSFAKIESLDEPVWRKDRIRAIDDHFIAAFLNRELRNDASMDVYLNPPTMRSSDGVWPLGRGEKAAEFAGHDAASAKDWPGFQRRWALGLELRHDKP